ncbi:MAG: HU family DNA-binding protein [Firmicutes bacterium]|nr:HU family DNA-binding protein [Bacillota bacterium]
MNKTELVSAIAEKAELSKKDAEKALKAYEEVITAELVAGNDVRLVGFGTFDVLERAEHEGRNPRTKEPMTIPASKAPRFRAGKALKDAVNGR